MINGSRIRRRQVQVAGRKWINFATKKNRFHVTEMRHDSQKLVQRCNAVPKSKQAEKFRNAFSVDVWFMHGNGNSFTAGRQMLRNAIGAWKCPTT